MIRSRSLCVLTLLQCWSVLDWTCISHITHFNHSTEVVSHPSVFVVYHFSRSLVDKLWHSVVDGLGDGSGYLRSELTILHHLTRGVQCQGKEGWGCQVQPEWETSKTRIYKLPALPQG